MIARAISRTHPLLKPKREIGMAMSKWWAKGHDPAADGEIRMHLSMHENQPIYPWLLTFPKKVSQRAYRYVWPFGSLMIIYAIQVYGKEGERQEDFEHRF
ncbi:hypothetical protein ACA910_021760 [Epithemia clementina (nom. ined.)]